MHSLRSFHCALAIVALGVSACAQADSTPLSLDEAIERALTDAPQLLAAAATAEGARAAGPSGGRLPDPELIVGVDNLPIEGEDAFSTSSDFMTMRKIGLMQSVPNRTKRRYQEERAQREIAVAEAELRKKRFEVGRAASDAWIARAVAEESLARLRELRPATELQATAGRAALASGRAAAAEALASQSIVANLDQRIFEFEQDAEMNRAELAQWIGESAERPLASIPTQREFGPSSEALLTAVPEHAPLAPLIARLAATQTEIELARAEKRPDWSTELTYGKRGADFDDMVSLEFRVGLPLFARNRQNPVIEEKLAALRAGEAERDAEVRMHTAEIRASLAEWRRGRERLQHYASELIPLAHDRSSAALASYAAGRGDLRGALEALSDEIDIQLEHVQLQGAVARAWVFLHLLHDSGASQ
jgi:cobalt-zinc-cadmium efflux system outer membrane protein